MSNDSGHKKNILLRNWSYTKPWGDSMLDRLSNPEEVSFEKITPNHLEQLFLEWGKENSSLERLYEAFLMKLHTSRGKSARRRYQQSALLSRDQHSPLPKPVQFDPASEVNALARRVLDVSSYTRIFEPWFEETYARHLELLRKTTDARQASNIRKRFRLNGILVIAWCTILNRIEWIQNGFAAMLPEPLRTLFSRIGR